jgi:arginyl-tRNA synthetase
MLTMPDVVTEAAECRETHELTKLCLEVAQLFSQFYRDCRVLTDDPAEAVYSPPRLALVDAVRQVLANALGLMGITAPTSM